MKKVLVAYFSKTGNTEIMAQMIAEGVRITGREADLKKVSEITDEKELNGYDAFVLWCPTYHLDMPEPFKRFLSIAEKAGLQEKIGGAFSSRSHPGGSEGGTAATIFEIMESRLKMKMTNLGPFNLEGGLTVQVQDMHTCQEYGKSIGKMLGPA